MTDALTPYEPTDEERLAALDLYLDLLKPIADQLRVKVTKDMGDRRVEKVGAYLADGTKIGSVSRLDGNVTAKLKDPDAALAWCKKNYPDEVKAVLVIGPAFLKGLLDHAKKTVKPGGTVIDPKTGEELPFIEVVRGAPYVRVDNTDDGVEAMAELAGDFVKALEGGDR